jgi:tetratricopeptide (TPR) repeat protein
MKLKSRWYWLIIIVVLGLGIAILTVLGISVVSALLDAKKINTFVTSELSAGELANKARQQQQNGDLPGAEQSLEEALLKEAKPDYQSQLAVVKYRLKKYEASIAEYQKLIDAKQDPAFAYNGMGNAYRDWAQTEDAQRAVRQSKALEAYKKALEADSGYLAAYTNQIILLADLGRKDEALQVANEGYSKTQRKELQELISQLR